MSAFLKSSHVFETHQIPLECDVYEAADYPSTSPVVLFTSHRGLSRQTCVQRRWPLVSASYRLLPQVDGEGLLDDAKAAYQFAGTLGGYEHRVIVAGARAGFFLATLIAHHLTPKPLALLSSSGIPTFRHPFFNSSTLIPPEPILEEEIERLVTEPVSVGTAPSRTFSVDMLHPLGSEYPAYRSPSWPQSDGQGQGQDPNRGVLYNNLLYENLYVALVGRVDRGFGWTFDPALNWKLAEWPFAIFLQADQDDDVDVDVCASVVKALGPTKVKLLAAPGQDHLFCRTSFIEDTTPEMDKVRSAIQELDRVLSGC